MFKWFDSVDAERFGVALAEKYHERYCVLREKKGIEHRKAEKLKDLKAELLIDAVRFNAERKLNIYKKAKFGNAFKWRMLDQGYEKSDVDAFLKDLMLALR